jgi:hypothetical protein
MDISGALGSALIGCASWILFAFGGQPIRRFWDTRGDVAHACNLYARFIFEPPSFEEKLWLTDNKDRDAAKIEFGKLGLQLITFHENEALASFVLERFSISPKACGRLLLQLSENLNSGTSMGPRRSDILRFLRLPP